MPSQAMHAVIGGDRTVPTSPVVHQAPRPMPTGLDWGIAPEPSQLAAAPAPKAAPRRAPRTNAPRPRGSQRNAPSRAKTTHDGRASYADRVNARLAALGVTSGDIRNWADKEGMPYNPRGLIRETIIDAYEAAHPTQRSDR